MKRTKKQKYIIASLIIIVAIAIFVLPHVVQFVGYNIAIKNMNEGNYEKALNWFQKNEYTLEIQECNYLWANNLLKQNDFDDASTIFKQLGNYKNSSKMITECKYQEAKYNYENKNYQQAIRLFDELSDYKDCKEQYANSIYELGKQCYEEGNLFEATILLEEAKNRKCDSAKKLYNEIITNNSDFFYNMAESEYEKGNFSIALQANSYGVRSKNRMPSNINFDVTACTLMNYVQGDYVGSKNGKFIEGNYDAHERKATINGYIFTVDGEEHTIEPYDKDMDSIMDTIIIDGDPQQSIVYVEDGEIWQKRNNATDTIWETKEHIEGRNERELQKEQEELANIKPNPAIGMTEQEVLDSAWGEPRNKNITTTVWGTTEQWVYSNNRYIYFDNGIVTAISQSE